MKRERKATVRVIVRQKNDPTKQTYVNLMDLIKAYPHNHLMWNYRHETYGELYGLRAWYGYDWYFLDRETNRWTYLCRSWERVPTYTVKKAAFSFAINRPWLKPAEMISSPKLDGARVVNFRHRGGAKGQITLYR